MKAPAAPCSNRGLFCMPPVLLATLLLATLLLARLAAPSVAAGGDLRISVVDAESGDPLPASFHLKNAKDRPRKIPKVPYWHDHAAIEGELLLTVPKGTYRFEVERGPEYQHIDGHFTMENFGNDEKQIALQRRVNMAAEGWWSGDLYIQRPLHQIELVLRADDLHVAPIITLANGKILETIGNPTNEAQRFDENRFYRPHAVLWEHPAGAVGIFNLETIPAGLKDKPDPQVSTTEVLTTVREQPSAWIDAATPNTWDLPVWLAAGQVDSISLATRHMLRDGMQADKVGYLRDKSQLRFPRTLGDWGMDIYFHVLNCGLRIPPSAGSFSGLVPNAAGYNRIYVAVEPGQFDYQTWFEAFKAGRVTVCNGPIIQPQANGRLPGEVFQLAAGESLTVDIAMNLATSEPLRYLEVIQNGQVIHGIRLEDWAKTGHFPKFEVKESGWFLVRVATENTKTFRFAMSAPWYVEVAGAAPRISHRSAEFFNTWLDLREEKFPADAAARHFWKEKLSAANAE